MGHCKYVCDKENRTCFDLGKWAPSDMDTLCELVNQVECTFEEFRSIIAQEWADVYEPEKIVALYEYIRSVKPENYAFAYHEDQLWEDIFDIWNVKKPVHEVGTVYTGDDLWIFGKQFVER